MLLSIGCKAVASRFMNLNLIVSHDEVGPTGTFGPSRSFARSLASFVGRGGVSGVRGEQCLAAGHSALQGPERLSALGSEALLLAGSGYWAGAWTLLLRELSKLPPAELLPRFAAAGHD